MLFLWHCSVDRQNKLMSKFPVNLEIAFESYAHFFRGCGGAYTRDLYLFPNRCLLRRLCIRLYMWMLCKLTLLRKHTAYCLPWPYVRTIYAVCVEISWQTWHRVRCWVECSYVGQATFATLPEYVVRGNCCWVMIIRFNFPMSWAFYAISGSLVIAEVRVHVAEFPCRDRPKLCVRTKWLIYHVYILFVGFITMILYFLGRKQCSFISGVVRSRCSRTITRWESDPFRAI